METSEKLERGRRSPATMSSGGAKGGQRRQPPGEEQSTGEWCSEAYEGPEKLREVRVATEGHRRRGFSGNGGGGALGFVGDWVCVKRKRGHWEVLGGL